MCDSNAKKRKREFIQNEIRRRDDSLTIEKKIKIIADVDKKVKYEEIVRNYNLKNKSNITRIIQNREKIEEAYCGTLSSERLTLKESTYATIDEQLLQFISKCAQKGVPTTTFCLKEKALEIAKRENLINFKASEGYIHRFKKRNKICFENIHGEAGGVNEDVCSEWLDVKLPKHLEDYAPKDIYNADELGLFWRVTPEKTYLIKGNKCKKGKQAKERVTVLTCANMDGSDKLQLVVIG